MSKSLEDRRALAERDSLRRANKTRTIDERCGSVSGYLAHVRRVPKERPCKACRKEWAAYNRKSRRKNIQ